MEHYLSPLAGVWVSKWEVIAAIENAEKATDFMVEHTPAGSVRDRWEAYRGALRELRHLVESLGEPGLFYRSLHFTESESGPLGPGERYAAPPGEVESPEDIYGPEVDL